MSFEGIEEIFEEKVFIDVSSDVSWQFFHKSHVFVRLDGVILIIAPVILKILFESFDHFSAQRSALVKM